MGAYTGTIRFRNGNGNLDTFIASTNELFDAIEATGMVPVPVSELPGQCGRLVKQGPVGDGETLKDSLATTGYFGTSYWNAYRHPDIGFYIKVISYDSAFTSTSLRVMLCRYQIFWEISEGQPVQPVTIDPMGAGAYSSGDGLSHLVNGYSDLYASMGPDHFWITSSPNLSHVISTSYSPKYSPTGKSVVAFGVFTSGRKCVAMVPAVTYMNRGLPYLGTNTSSIAQDTNYRYSAMRYYVSDSEIRTPFQFLGGAAAGYLINAMVSTTSVGVRVARASLVIDGEYCEPDFGFVSMGAVNDGQTIILDLDGAGPRTYKVGIGFGNANPAPNSFSTNAGEHETIYPPKMFSVAVLPWNQEP